ncbi:hypothetical protein GCM10007103_19710 [Salinimicrobium marinum]|uniref:Uncharacterized protein n=1 Tax=Salinimicrobium marinum TaxID=680283 RepID=A0A918VX96_9FLAO|nr:hypothetical protein [Salinimicrobium marinum]GHA38382.1 hypothetical protein GCM10007103_19710 [Salinimicrobium marinum]
MHFNIFLFFPTAEIPDDYLDGYFLYDYNSFILLIKEVLHVKQQLKGRSFTFFYDSENVKEFLGLVNAFVEEQEQKDDIQKILRKIVSSYSLDVSTRKIKNPEYIFYLWNSNNINGIAPPILIKALDILQQKDENTIVFTLANHLSEQNHELNIIKDSLQDPVYPVLHKLPYAFSDCDFITWLRKFDNDQFTLHDQTKFKPTPYRWRKQRIYQCKITGQFWYFDYYHKDNKAHYEVFSSDGKIHLGEANLFGQLNPENANESKSIKDCIK